MRPFIASFGARPAYSARPRESGDPGARMENVAIFILDSRLRGNERGNALAAPHHYQPAVLAQHRIAVRHRHLLDGRERTVAVGRVVAAAKIVGPVRRISADHEKIVAAQQALMPGAGRQQRNVAGLELESLAVMAAELHAGRAFRDAERLVY